MNSPGQPSMLELFTPFAVMLVIFYFLIIRPQRKKLQDHDKLLGSLKRGDAVFTASGMLGTVDGMTDTIVTLEVTQGVKIKVLRKYVTGLQNQLDRGAEKRP